VKSSILLYVKSEKVSIVPITEGIYDHPCSGARRATQTFHNYKPEDQKAMDLLEEAGTNHQIIDLSNCSFATQLMAKIKGINETPTLIMNGRKIKGSENITQILQEIKT
jgi:glutaredoxin